MIRLFTGPSHQASSADSQMKATADPARLNEISRRLQSLLGEHLRVLSPVAIGGMATIFRVQHNVHHGIFVAKVLHPELSTHAEVTESFRRETMHLAALADHPGIVPIYDCNLTSNPQFLLMPFVEGEDLDQTLARGPLSRSEALHMAAQISSVLCHAESHGISHCDITPGNIRLDVFGRYRLLDFGLSRASREPCISHPKGGTPLYVSPEQVRGEAPDHRSDLYSLGLVLAEALIGKPLIHGKSLDAIHRMHLDGSWSLPDTLQKDIPVAHLLKNLLNVAPKARMQSAYELSGSLAALGFERPEFQQRLAPTSSTKRRSRLIPS